MLQKKKMMLQLRGREFLVYLCTVMDFSFGTKAKMWTFIYNYMDIQNISEFNQNQHLFTIEHICLK